MATYLLMNECGFDAAAVGFPSLQGCVGIVLQTTTGLFGWHIFGAVDLPTLAVMAPKFKSLIDTTPNAGNAVKLYGARFRRYRSEHAGDWKAELRTIADGIEFTGTIGGYDIGRDSSLTKSDSAYVEFTRDAAGQRCRLIYKRSSKMNYQSGTLQPGTPIFTIRGDADAKIAHFKESGTSKAFYKIASPTDMMAEQLKLPEDQRIELEYTTGVGTNALSKKGVMHSVSNSNINYFWHP